MAPMPLQGATLPRSGKRRELKPTTASIAVVGGIACMVAAAVVMLVGRPPSDPSPDALASAAAPTPTTPPQAPTTAAPPTTPTKPDPSAASGLRIPDGRVSRPGNVYASGRKIGKTKRALARALRSQVHPRLDHSRGALPGVALPRRNRGRRVPRLDDVLNVEGRAKAAPAAKKALARRWEIGALPQTPRGGCPAPRPRTRQCLDLGRQRASALSKGTTSPADTSALLSWLARWSPVLQRPVGRTAHCAVLPQTSRHCLVRGPGGG